MARGSGHESGIIGGDTGLGQQWANIDASVTAAGLQERQTKHTDFGLMVGEVVLILVGNDQNALV